MACDRREVCGLPAGGGPHRDGDPRAGAHRDPGDHRACARRRRRTCDRPVCDRPACGRPACGRPVCGRQVCGRQACGRQACGRQACDRAAGRRDHRAAHERRDHWAARDRCGRGRACAGLRDRDRAGPHRARHRARRRARHRARHRARRRARRDTAACTDRPGARRRCAADPRGRSATARPPVDGHARSARRAIRSEAVADHPANAGPRDAAAARSPDSGIARSSGRGREPWNSSWRRLPPRRPGGDRAEERDGPAERAAPVASEGRGLDPPHRARSDAADRPGGTSAACPATGVPHLQIADAVRDLRNVEEARRPRIGAAARRLRTGARHPTGARTLPAAVQVARIRKADSVRRPGWAARRSGFSGAELPLPRPRGHPRRDPRRDRP